MEHIRGPVVFVSLYLLLYTISPFIGLHAAVTTAMYVVAPLLVLWLLYVVMKHGEPSQKKFSGGVWYEDSNIGGMPEGTANPDSGKSE